MTTGTLIIDGGGGITISGDDSYLPFTILPAGNLTLRHLTVTKGETTGDGGGIRNNGGVVALESVTMSDNHAADYGGAIYSSGEVEISDSTLDGNRARLGGALYASYVASIERSTLSDNVAGERGGGIYNDGAEITITESTLSDNVAGIFGGGIFNRNDTLEIYNSTISGNRAPGGGGIRNDDSGVLRIVNSTVANNEASDAGGIDNTGDVTVVNSIVGDNTATGEGNCDNNPPGTFTAVGNNLDTDGTCLGFGEVTSAQLNVGPLLNWGGPTRTHALLAGSLAINTGVQAKCDDEGITTDQRGYDRDGQCDIGAFEYGAGPEVDSADLVISKGVNKTSVKQGELLTYTTTVHNYGPDTAVKVVVEDTLSSGTTFVSAWANTGAITKKPSVGQSGTVTWALGDLLDGGEEAATIVVKVLARGKTTITNTATVSSDTYDPNPADNTASITVSVTAGGGKKK